MIYNIAIDSDSIVYKACHRHMFQESTSLALSEMNSADKAGVPKDDIDTNIELAYMEFCGIMNEICSNIFTGKCKGCESIYKGLIEYQKGDIVKPLIVLSPRKSFRNEISPSGINFGVISRGKNKGEPKDLGYKANRDPDAWSVPRIRELKRLIAFRLKDVVFLDNLFGEQKGKPEADDVCNYFSRVHGYFVSAIDKDVIEANETYTLDYNKMKWEIPRNKHQIEQWYLSQTLMGDSTDNVAGAPGIGEKSARSIVMGTYNNDCAYEDIIQYFDNELDCLINHTLVRMDGFDGKNVIPWSP